MNIRICLLALVLIPLISACGDRATTKQIDIPKVKVVQVGDSLLKDGRLYFPAVAHAADRSRLSFRVPGEVSELNVKEGDRVTKGSVIALIDPTDFNLDVDNATASYTVANSQYRRSEPLVKKGMLAQSQFDELAAKRMIAKSELDLAKLRLSFTQLRAPYDGIISRVNVDQFENIQPGQQVVNLHNPTAVDIVVQVPDQLFTTVPSEFEFQNVQADVRVKNGEIYRASLKEYTTEQDQESATYTVTLTMPMPEDQIILDGMAVDVAPIEGGVGALDSASLTITVPVEAIFNPDGVSLDRENKYVWLVNDDNSVRKAKVITRKFSYKHIQVVEGLDKGDKVVIAGISRLRDGVKVELITSPMSDQESVK